MYFTKQGPVPWEVIELKLIRELNCKPSELAGENLIHCMRLLTVMEFEQKWPNAK